MGSEIGSLTIHHWTDLKSGFSKLNKVLKPNGRINPPARASKFIETDGQANQRLRKQGSCGKAGVA